MRDFMRLLKILPFLLFINIEGSDLKKSKHEQQQARNEIMKIKPNLIASTPRKPLTLNLLLDGINKNFSLLK